MSDFEQLEYIQYLSEYEKELYEWHKEWHKELIKKYSKPSRKNNGKNEIQNIEDIVYNLNRGTELGIKLIKYLKKQCSIDFIRADIRNGSNRKTHYDFIIVDKQGNEHRVEHKGSYKYKKIKENNRPWCNSVQFVNAGCEKFEICRLYARIWYEEYIQSGYLSKTYKLKSDIPTFNSWYKSDCCTQGDPKTLFGKEFKTVYRNEYGNTSPLSMRGKINKKFLELVESNSKILNDFNISAVSIADKHMKEKNVWLQITGDINGDIEKIDFKWHKEYKVDKIYKIQTIKSNSDIDFMFVGEDPMYLDFSCKLRWGNGTGFSNLRVGFN